MTIFITSIILIAAYPFVPFILLEDLFDRHGVETTIINHFRYLSVRPRPQCFPLIYKPTYIYIKSGKHKQKYYVYNKI